MTFIGVTPGEIFNNSGAYQWEYLAGIADSFIHPDYGTWDTLYPPRISPLARISAVADVANGSHHPLDTHIPDSTLFFYLNFHATYRVEVACWAPPVRFYWINCSDNIIKYGPADNPSIAVSREVFEYEGYPITDTLDNHLPTYHGMPGICRDSLIGGSSQPLRIIDFRNTLMQFSCDSSNPLIGDLNLNGIPYEAADAAIFADYFVHREQAFSISVDSQMNATDINGDGGPGTISDYIYLSAILSGEMTPGQSIPPGSTGSLFNLIDSGTTVILSGRFRIPVGGIELWLYASDPASDNISLMPFDDGMDLDYARSGNYLRVLIHTDMTLGYPRDYIDSGYGEILKISYTNTKPILLFASAAGFSGENIQLNYPYPGQIDYRGDVNLNGIPNEVGDAVVFANYLLFGLCAFIINEQGQTEASDVDGDGVPLTVQDYAYLCGIMKGIFQPLPKGEAKSDGALIFVETDSSIIMSGAFSDSISVLYMKFYASGLSSSDQFRYHVLPGVDSMKVSYTSPFYLCLGDTFNILISPSLYPESGMVTINPGSAGLLEILTNVVKPEFISAAAAGRHAEFVNVSISAENNYPPYFPSYPGNLGNDYNGMFNHVFVAADSNLLPDRISYGIISGPGEINTVTGEWKFSPICAKVGDTFSLVICASDILHPCPQPDTNLYARVQLTITNPPPMLGDADNNGALNILDITYLINFIYRHGTPPMATAGIGDLNADGKVNILDLTYFINHLFKNGPAPICP